MNNTIYLIDAYAHIYRGYHAIPCLNTRSGKPSNALFAMGKFLLGIEKDLKPEYGAFAFDKGPPSGRLEILPEYKANRPSMPDELRAQIYPIRKMITTFGWNIIEKDNFEADDIIASLAYKFANSKINIISNDKDISQIIDDRVIMLVTTPGQKGVKIRNTESIEEKFGIRPSQIVDYLSLTGDSSDNIQGLAGVGPKTAAKLLKEYGSLENIITSAGNFANTTLSKKIKESVGILKRNMKLITLDKNIPLDNFKTKETLLINPPNVNALISIAEEYELNSLIADFKKLPPKELIQGEFCF